MRSRIRTEFFPIIGEDVMIKLMWPWHGIIGALVWPWMDHFDGGQMDQRPLIFPRKHTA